MNCDQVFDVLTRGPFPTGHPSDQAVESHLASCAECARLAEALRPAIELFEEAVTAEESRTLPGYWGQLATAQADVATLKFEKVARPSRKTQLAEATSRAATVLGNPTVWRFAAAVAFGVVTISALRTLGLSGPSPRINAASAFGANCLNHAFKQSTEQFAMHSASDSSPLDMQQLTRNGLACCTNCHNPKSAQRLSHADTLKVTTSCQHCHSDPGSAERSEVVTRPRG